jgi:hypothetical protein
MHQAKKKGFNTFGTDENKKPTELQSLMCIAASCISDVLLINL